MTVVLKKELEELENCLHDMSDIINGDDRTDGLELFYSDCTHQHKRLRELLDSLETKYNEIYDLFDMWYNRKQI